jgi:Uma2 family endonuclease
MIESQTQAISFEDFIKWYPEDGKRYELIEGVIVEILPTGSHEDLSGFIIAELNFEIRRQKLPYSIPRTCIIKPPRYQSGYQPDVIVINRELIKNEPLWSQSSVIQNSQTVPLVIEVVSTNWRDDYGHKFVEYEAMGIAEYWIVDYRALGAVRYIGKPKQRCDPADFTSAWERAPREPTITICQLIEDEYQMKKFIIGQRLESRIFPELEITTDTIFAAAELQN